MKDAEYFIDKLKMTAHPEGGYYSEFYRSSENIKKDSLPRRYSGDRSLGTSIYFLLKSGDFSTFHRLKSDEIWYFHCGSPINLYTIDEKGALTTSTMGYGPEESLQYLFPAGVWFGGGLSEENSFTLVSCSVFPGFDFEDFEMADREKLSKDFPQHHKLIERLTRT